MKYKNLFLTLIGFLLIVFYALYKRAPTIHNSLVDDGYKLVSSSDKKEEIYKNILKREGTAGINLILLDDYLIGVERRWEALSFWCDLETNKNSFLRSRKYQIRFCVMAIEDWAKWENKGERIHLFDSFQKQKPEEYKKFLKEVFEPEQSKNSEIKIDKLWFEYCRVNKVKPYWRENKSLARDVLYYCYT